MTTRGHAAVYRFVSDDRTARDIGRDAMARLNRPPLWAAIAVLGFATGFGSSYRSNQASLPHYRAEVIGIATVWGLVFVALTSGAAMVGMLLGAAATRVRMRRLYPEGSQTEVELGEDALVLRRPASTRSIPYADIREVRSRERVQWILIRRWPVAEALPGGLLPPDALETIQARSRGAEPRSTTPPPPPKGAVRTFVVPDGWADRVAATTARRTLSKPRLWMRLGLAILVLVPVAMVAGRAWLVLAPAVALLSIATGYVQTRRSIAFALPPGSLATTETQADRLVSRGARWTRVIPFEEVRRVEVLGDLVFLEMTSRPPLLVLALSLVPDELIEQRRGTRSRARWSSAARPGRRGPA